MSRIKKDDQVIVIAGKDKGNVGKVLRVFPKDDKVIVEKVNLIKRHTKPTQKNPKGGIQQKEQAIHVSNVMLIDPKTKKATRVGVRLDENGNKVRYSKRSGEVIV